MSEQLYDVLNRKHFTEGAVLNDIAMLLDAAAEVGVQRSECEVFLRGNMGVREVLETVARVHDLGIESIPCLVIDGGKKVLQGAAHSNAVLDALRRVVAEKNATCELCAVDVDIKSCAPSVFQDNLKFVGVN